MMSVIGCEWQRNLGYHVGKEAIFLGATCTNIQILITCQLIMSHQQIK